MREFKNSIISINGGKRQGKTARTIEMCREYISTGKKVLVISIEGENYERIKQFKGKEE